MQIQVQQPNRKNELNVTTRDFNLTEGHTGYVVSVGERVVGFAGEDVSSVSLRISDGRLHIQLQAASGDSLGEYQVPSTDLLRKNLNGLADRGIFFSSGEVEELANLMRLSMSGSVSRQEILLMLDEISHVAPEATGATTLDAGDIYPDLNQNVRQLLGVMPEEIQRFVLLNNMDHFSDDSWRAFHLISKMDSNKQPALTRFLAGGVPFSYVAEAEMAELAASTPLTRANPISDIDPKAFQALIKQLSDTPVSGDYRSFHFPQPLAKFIFDSFPVQVPDFAAASSFEELESKFMSQFKASHPLPGKSEDPLGKHLLRFLDASKYRELSEFLVGKPGAVFGTEAREGFLHFLKQPTPDPLAQSLGSIGQQPYERLLRFARNQSLDIPKLLQDHPHYGVENEGNGPDLQPELGRDFNKLTRSQKLAFFVLDHLDPIRDKPLFQYFNGEQAGLSKMTASLTRELHSFLEKGHIPEVRGGLNRLVPERLQELSLFMEGHNELQEPEDYLPTNARLRGALFDMVGDEDSPDVEPAVESSPMLARESVNSKRLAASILEETKGLVGTPLSEKLTVLLKRYLGQFRQVAMLDQVWKGQELSKGILAGNGPVSERARELSDVLRSLSGLLAADGEDDIDWDLWQKPLQPKSKDPHPSFREKLLTEHSGTERYFELDKQLPQRASGLGERVEELSWMRRFEDLAARIDRHRDDNHARLFSVLERVTKELSDMSKLITVGDERDWHYHGKSPLTRKKQEQFQVFRDAVLAGDKGSPDGLFEGPFLRSEFSSSAEKQQSLEMKRLEPLFKEALSRLEVEPAKALEKLLETLVKPAEIKSPDASSHVQRLVENLHDFNQHQSLNQQPMYLNLPLKWGDQESDMELALFRLPGGEDKHRFLVVVHLDFEHWGHLRIDALKEGSNLSASFWVENAEMKHKIQRDLSRLEKSLAGQNITDVSLSVKLEAKRASASVADLCVPRHDGELDVEI